MEKQKRKGVIYKLIFPNGKVYIGKTIEKVEKRFGKHISSAYIKTSHEYNTKLSRAIRKYGKESIIIEVIKIDVEEDNLDNEEIESILYFNSKRNGYNSTNGGSGIVGFKYSEKQKEEMSKRRKKLLMERPELITNGIKNGQAKITWEDVKEIRRLYREDTNITQNQLAEKFGLSRRAIGLILTNKNWYDPEYDGNTDGFKKSAKLSKEDIGTIRELYKTGRYNYAEIGKMYNVCFQLIHQIVKNKIHNT